MKKINKILGLTATSLLFMSEPVLAANMGTLSSGITGQMPAVANLLSAVAYIAGVGFGIKAALKLKEHNESKGQIPLSQPITLAVVAGVLLGLPSFLSAAKETTLGGGAQGTSLNGGGGIQAIQ